MGLQDKGFLSTSELKKRNRYPSDERIKKGDVAVIECSQEIPCDPCEDACPFDAIKVGKPITNLPQLDEEKCTGCGQCVAKCPGLAIFLINKGYTEKMSTVSFPYEFNELPEKGEEVDAVDRDGEIVCKGKVVNVLVNDNFDRTAVVTISVPNKYIDDVRSMGRLDLEEED